MDRSGRHKRMTGVARMLLAVFACTVTPTVAHATQHLVDPGQDWSKLVKVARPGDEILLMPGSHMAVTLRDLKGTAAQPIMVRGIDPRNPPLLRGPRPALTLINAEHVVFENFVIEDCAMTAVVLMNESASPPQPESTPGKAKRPGAVVLRDFTVRQVGPDTNARAVILNEVSNVKLEQWTFESWSGRALEMFGCTEITIDRCTFIGDDIFDPELAVLVYGGSRFVTIKECTFRDAGYTTAVMLGGRTEPQMFDGLPARATNAAPVAEADQCVVVDSTFQNQACPIVLSHADRCAVRNCTFVRPRRYVAALLSMHGDDGRFMSVTRPTFSSNLAVWTAGELTGLLLIDEHNRQTKIVLESNLWWSNELAERRTRMLPRTVAEAWPQVVDVDPKLDTKLQPQNEDASMYGARE